MKLPLLEKFYDEKAFLTASKVIGNRFDNTREYIKNNNIDTCVMVFNEHLENSLKKLGKVKTLDFLYMGEDKHYFYVVDNVLFVIAFMSAPNAAVLMEEVADMGITKFLACGSAGLIDNSFDSKKMLIVTESIRDEGTSYHYAPPEVKAETDVEISKIIGEVFKSIGIHYEYGKLWTNDALFRETQSIIDRRVEQGCVGVDMECSAWSIIAKYLGVKFGEFVYFSDAVVEEEWNWIDQDKFNDTTDRITMLAYEIAKRL